MKKRILDFFIRFKNEIMTICIFMGGICGAIGSYMYYKPVLSGYRLVFAVLYSTIKLFIFTPVIPIDADYSVLFEIGKWLAPLATLIGLFSIFGNVFYKIKQMIMSYGTYNYIVFGNSEDARKLLGNIIKEDNRAIGYLIVDSSEFLNNEEELIKIGIKTEYLNFEAENYIVKNGFKNSALYEKIKSLKLKKAKHIIFFDSEMENYGRLKSLLKYLPERKNKYKILMRYETDEIKEIIESDIDEADNLNVDFFNFEERIAQELLQKSCRPYRRLNAESSDDSQTLKINSEFSIEKEILNSQAPLNAISSYLGQMHILIIGFGKLGRAVLIQSLNIMVVNPDKKLRITIADKNINEKFSDFIADYRQISEMAEIELINENVLHRDFYKEIINIDSKNKINNIIFTLDNYKNVIIVLNRLKGILPDTDIAVRTRKLKNAEIFAERLREYYSNITLFGEESQVLGKGFVLENEVKEKAIEFNYRYNINAARIMGYDEPKDSAFSMWEGLNTVKKESSFNQIFHNSTKHKLIQFFIESGILPAGLTVDQVLESWEEVIKNKDIDEQINIIEKDPLMNYFAALEHRRWCNFYFLRNFSYSEKKDEKALKHDCLITDWDKFLKSSKRNTAIYDFIAVLNK